MTTDEVQAVIRELRARVCRTPSGKVVLAGDDVPASLRARLVPVLEFHADELARRAALAKRAATLTTACELLALLADLGLELVPDADKATLSGNVDKVPPAVRELLPALVDRHRDELARLAKTPASTRRIVTDDGEIVREFVPGGDFAALMAEHEARPGVALHLQAWLTEGHGRWETFATAISTAISTTPGTEPAPRPGGSPSSGP